MAHPTLVKTDELLNRARSLIFEGSAQNLDKAEHILSAVLNGKPTDPFPLYLMGSLFHMKGAYGVAYHLLVEAAKGYPRGPIFNNLALVLQKLGLHEQAESAFQEAIRLHQKHDGAVPDETYCNLAGIFVNAGRAADCLRYANLALKSNPDNVKAQWNKALALLELQQWGEAWEWHESRLQKGHSGVSIAMRNYAQEGMTPWWDGTSPGFVVVHGEQGLGDEIMFCTALEDAARVRGVEMVVECSPRLEKLFARSFSHLSNVTVIGTNETDGKEWRDGRPVDYKIAMGSLPKFWRKREQDFPRTNYLKADPALVSEYRNRIPPGRMRVGVAWQGGALSTHIDLRTLWLPALKLVLQQDADFVSLAYHEGARDNIKDLRDETGLDIHHWPEAVEAPADMDHLAAVIAGCDLVITVSQTALHVAGALGVPCWVMVPSKPDWRLGMTREHTAWYGPHLRLIRQKMGEDWGPVIERVALDLRGLIEQRRAA